MSIKWSKVSKWPKTLINWLSKNISTLSVSILVKLFNHRHQLFFFQSLSQLLCYFSQIIQPNPSFAFQIKKFESLQSFLNRISFWVFPFHDLNVIFIWNPAWLFDVKLSCKLHHLWLFNFKSESSEDYFELVICYVWSFMRIEKFKGFPYFCVLFWS